MSVSFKIDKLGTQQIHSSLELNMCDCPDCQRYYQYMKQLLLPAKTFFEEAGIDPMKCQELWAYFPDDNGYVHYSGFFYVSVKPAESSGPFIVTEDWKTLDYGICSFRVRLEYTADKKTIIGFEADLPVWHQLKV